MEIFFYFKNPDIGMLTVMPDTYNGLTSLDNILEKQISP